MLVKMNMRQLAGWELWRFFWSAGRAGLGLVILAGLTLNVAQAQPVTPPANDNFTNAINLTAYGDSGSTTGSNVGATIQPGEQLIGAFAGSVFASVWYSWTASTNETTEFDVTGSQFGTNLTIVQIFINNGGTGISNLVWQSYGYYGYFGGISNLYNFTNSFQARAGQTYYISVAGYAYQGATGSIQLNWSSSAPIPPPLNDNFADATVLAGDWGSTTGNSSLATHEPGEPSRAGYPPNASLWYQWTATHDGEVTLDTIGSSVDTLLAVYTGTSLGSLNQIAVNDDLYPVNSTLPTVDLTDEAYNESWDIISVSTSTGGGTITTSGGLTRFGYLQPYYGPSGLRFNARAGVTYYFAVDSKSFGGAISLNWAYKPSGVFRWATEDVDPYAISSGSSASSYTPVYKTADTESQPPVGNNNSSLSVVSTYYNYNAPGALVTVTRLAGSSGRAMVDYTTVDGTSVSISPYDAPAFAGINYTPVSGTLIFDDFEMSKTVLIPIIASSDYNGINSEFGVMLSNPQLDPYESGAVSAPRVDPNFNVALVKILNTEGDPYGPNYIRQVFTNGFSDPSNTIPILVTNFVAALYPTNAIFNFEKANYRVPADVNGTNSSWAQVTLWVERFGTNTSQQAVNYRVNNFVGVDQDASEEDNAYFPLQPGSDYAVPTPPTNNVFRGRNSDFVLTKGTLNFPASPAADYAYQPLTFTVPLSALTKFNKDFKIQLFHVVNNTVKLVGMNAETTVTILFNDMNPPAGSVDEFYNADFNGDLALPPQLVPQTWPANNLNNPGVSGQVYGLVVLTNNQTLIAGNFVSYNGYAQNNIALLNPDGSMDTSFNPGQGPNGSINAVARLGSQFVIGGDFTSYDTGGVGHFARVNANGSLDSAFSVGHGSGADGVVRAVAVQPDGKVIIGGDFTQVDGIARNYLARLNANGSLDTNFDPGLTLNGPVYSLATAPPVRFSRAVNGDAATNESVQVVNFPPYTSGVLQFSYNFGPSTNALQVYYGTTNVAAGTGVLLFDTGSTTGGAAFNLPFGPVGALAASQITVVVNQGTDTNGSAGWSYSGTASPFSPIVVGGQFSVAGQGYANLARFTANGLLDTTFSPGTGTDGKVLALAWQLNNQIVAGGVFTHVNGNSYNRLVRFNADGSIDTTNFFAGTGADDVVYNVTLDTATGAIYIGGQFSSFNGTHRLGLARLYANGTVDTTFLDTAYNQFAGLKKIYSYDLPAVFASGLQTDGNVMIGGSFQQVGGGQADPAVCNTLDGELGYAQSFGDVNLWVEPKARDGVRNRSGIARLIGGSTPGPGNLGLQQTSYSANKSQSSLSVGLTRANGNLGPVSANFSVVPGLAQSGSDYAYFGAAPMFWIDWLYRADPNQSRMREDGLAGNSGFLVDPYGLFLTTAIKEKALNQMSLVTVNIIKNTQKSGNLNAQFQLANPAQQDFFYLGGQNIPLGTALGTTLVPLSIIDDSQKPGVFGFSSASYIATNLSPVIPVLRSNGVAGNITVRYSTINSNSTAVVGADYTGLTNAGPLAFNQGVVSNAFTVTVKDAGIIYTNQVEKTVAVALSQLGNIPPGATYGISNAVLRLINPNYRGYLTLTATNYSANESSGVLNFVVTRVGGSLGSLSIQYATADGPSATNGVDYVGSTNTLTWNSGEVSQRSINVPLINTGTVGANRQFHVALSNPMVGTTNTPGLMGSFSNATLTIVNDNHTGALQFSAPSYTVNENGGYATISVVRTGGNAGSISGHYSTSDGTAATGLNYTAVSGTVTLATGQIFTNIIIPILNDGVVDPPPANFYFNVTLDGPGTLVNTAVHIVDAQTYNRPPGSADTGFLAAGMNGSVFSLALQPGGQILAGGNFTAVGSTGEGSFARLNPDGTLDTTFLSGLSGANGAVQAIACQTDGRILLGGGFSSINGGFRRFIARVMTDGSLDSSFNPGPGADNVVNTLAETFIGGVREIYVGGAFGSISGGASPGVARLNNDGSFDGSFAVGTGADGAVLAVAVYPTNSLDAGKLLVGGAFSHFNGTPLNGLARLNVDGSLDTNFNAGFGLGAAGSVRALAIQLDGRVLVGGSFTSFNGNPAGYIVRLNPDGTVDTNFVAGASDAVEAIALQPDNRIVLAGSFTRANGVTRNHVTRLLPTGAPDPTINFGSGADGDVDTVVIQPADGQFVIGGTFTEYNDQPAKNIARIYGGSVTGSGQFEFTAANYQVLENATFAQLTIRRTGGTSGTNSDGSGDILVNCATTTGTAVPGVNYTPVNLNVDFPAGEVLRTVVVPVLDDGTIAPDLTVTNWLAAPTPPAGLGAQPYCVLTIVNVDSAVSFLTPPFYTVQKNVANGFATIDVIRQGSLNGTSTVNFLTTTNGTANPTTDYTPVSGTLTFNPGESDKTFQISVNNNGLAEGNQTVGLALANAANALLYSPSNATLTIIDTTPAPGRLSFSATNYVVSSAGTNAVVTIVRTNGSVGQVSVNFQIIPGTALPGVNYLAPASTNVTFLAGETAKDVLVPLVNTATVQPLVTFAMVLAHPTGGAVLIDPTNTTVIIVNNNTGVSFVSATNYVSETNATGLIYVQRLGNPTNGFHVNYATTNGTALAGINYGATAGTLTFVGGETVKTIAVPLMNHQMVTNLTFGIALSNPDPGIQIVAPSNALVVLQAGAAGLSFTNAAMSVAKNIGIAVIPVVCSNPGIEPVIVDSNTVPLSVQYYTTDGTALSGQDYTGRSGTLVFTNGVATNTISVPISNDSRITGSRTFTVVLTNVTAPGRIISPSNQVVTIIDNNAGLSFSSANYLVNRTNVFTTITILRTDNTNQTSSVNFATADGTGVAGTDYFPTNGTCVFTNGVTSQAFAVRVIAGTTIQPDKTVLLQLSSPSSGSYVVAPGAAVLTIHDSSGSLVVPSGSALVHEYLLPNGIIDPGEKVDIMFAFRAAGGNDVTNLYATLLATNGVTAPSPGTPVSYGPLHVGGPSASRTFSFTAAGTNSQQIAATFLLNNGVTNIGTALFTYTLGTWTTLFYNTNAIIINAAGPGLPYPSPITVSNLGGVLIKAVVTLTNMTHSAPSAVNVLLVSPGQKDTLLMSHVGGGQFGGAVNGVTVTLDDAATNSLPSNGQITNGVYKPSQFGGAPTFP
jgi:uncharacterized delta-60 repeat protein